MKPLENILVTPSHPGSRLASDQTHLDKLKTYVGGEAVRGDDLLKAALWLVTEVLRRNETPAFRRGFLNDRLQTVAKLAGKYNLLLQCWPGATPPSEHMIQTQKLALDMVSTLVSYAPVAAHD